MSAIGLLLLLITWLRGDGGATLLAVIVALIVTLEASGRFLTGRGSTPYMAMALAPLLLVHYSSVQDFRIRLACFVLLLAVMALTLRAPAAASGLRNFRLSPGRAWLLAWLVFSLAAAGLSARGLHLSGDEPHYLMIAQSLVEDGDFDLKNNLDNKTYFSYLPVEIRFHGSVHSGRYHSFHMPGLAFLLAPFFLLFKLMGGWLPGPLFFRLAAGLINSLFALGLFLALRSLWPGENRGGFFLFFLLSFPLLFHAVHLYPELPAATLMLFAYLAAREKGSIFIAGLLMAAVPWFHLKYVPPLLVLAAFVCWGSVRKGGGAWVIGRRLASFIAVPALSFMMLVLYSRALYGSYDPRAISPEGNFLSIPLKFMVETLLSFFLDQRDGLLLYAPLFALVFLAWKKRVRGEIRDFALLSSLFLAYVLFHAMTTVRGAYSPAARPTLFVYWIMALFLIAVFRRSGTHLRLLFRLLAGMTAFASLWFLYYPLFLYQPVTREVTRRASSWLAYLSSDAIDLPAFFPSFLKTGGNGAWLPNWLWPGLLVLIWLAFFRRTPLPRFGKSARALLPLVGLALLFLFCWVPHVRLQSRYSAAGLSFYCNSRNFSYNAEPDAFRIKAGADYELFIDLKGSAANEMNLTLLNGQHVGLVLRNGRQRLMAVRSFPRAELRRPLANLKRFRLGNRELVHIGLETTALEKGTFFWLKLD